MPRTVVAIDNSTNRSSSNTAKAALAVALAAMAIAASEEVGAPAVFHCFGVGGVGGVGHANSLVCAHMVDATQCTQYNRNARVLLSPRHTVDATQCARLAEPAHMVDATQCTCLSTRSCPTQGIFERCPSCTNLLQRVLSKSRSVPFIQMATRLGKMNVADWV